MNIGISTQAKRGLYFCFLLSVFCFSAYPQNYSIDWLTIDGGGGTSSGGTFSLSGTIGQSDPSVMAGGNFSLNGGFWSALSVARVPAAPLLSVERLGNAVRIFWPVRAAGFVLDESLTPSGGWSQVGVPYVTNGLEISITVTEPNGHKFYRLRKL